MPTLRLILLSLSLFLLIWVYGQIPSYLGPKGLRNRRPPSRFIRVETSEAFDGVLKEERAAVFFSSRWSIDSVKSQRTAGGTATVRGLASGLPYLGEGGQFSGLHRDRAVGGKLITHVLVGDGSVYPFSSSVSTTVFEARATINGGEEVGDFSR